MWHQSTEYCKYIHKTLRHGPHHRQGLVCTVMQDGISAHLPELCNGPCCCCCFCVAAVVNLLPWSPCSCHVTSCVHMETQVASWLLWLGTSACLTSCASDGQLGSGATVAGDLWQCLKHTSATSPYIRANPTTPDMATIAQTIVGSCPMTQRACSCLPESTTVCVWQL